MITKSFHTQSLFWNKDTPRVLGDILNRPQAVNLLGRITHSKVLEAGCGTGYIARMLARKGAAVYGCDRENEMLKYAFEEETQRPLGIHYDAYDVMHTGYTADFFDAILCVGVLTYSTTSELSDFYREALRVLKHGGALVIGVLHPSLYNPQSPCRASNVCWAHITPLESAPLSISQRFTFELFDSDGNCFTTEIFHHSFSEYINSAIKEGFVVEEIRESYVQKEHLLADRWGTEVNYPVYVHVKFKKP